MQPLSNRDRLLNAETDSRLDRDGSRPAPRKQDVARSSNSAHSGPDRRALSSARDGSDYRAYGGAARHLGGVLAVGFRRALDEGRRADANVLRVRGREHDQLDRETSDAVHAAAGVAFDDTSLDARALLGDNESIDHQRLVQRREESIAGPVALRGDRLADADR